MQRSINFHKKTFSLLEYYEQSFVFIFCMEGSRVKPNNLQLLTEKKVFEMKNSRGDKVVSNEAHEWDANCCYATFLRLPMTNLHLNRSREIFSSISKGEKNRFENKQEFYFPPKKIYGK